MTLAQNILHWRDQNQIISPYKSEFDYNFMRNSSMFFYLYNRVKRTSLEVEAWFVEGNFYFHKHIIVGIDLIVFCTIGFGMNPEDIRYWFKMGVRVNTLYRIINELAFYINDFIPVDFIQEVLDSLVYFIKPIITFYFLNRQVILNGD
jgi:hypothetical protein